MDLQVVSDADKLPIVREDALLAKVLESGNIEVLKEFIALRAQEEARQSRIQFEENFARMRAELPRITKSKNVDIRGKRAYSYAPIEDIQKVCDPIIFKHGFTYSWREEAIPEGKRVWLDIMGYGHTKSNYFDSPRLDPIQSREGFNVTNVVQMAGQMSTYGKRYSFVSGFGLIVEGEDADAQTVEIPQELSDALDKIRNADTLDKLMAAYQIAYERFKSDQNHLRLVVGEYTIAKKAMAGAK